MSDNIAITFDRLKASEEVPGTYGEIDRSQAMRRFVGRVNRRVCLVGQMTAGGEAEVGSLERIFDTDDLLTFFGAGSELDLMGRAALATDNLVELLAVAADPQSGAVDAEATMTFGGSAATTDVMAEARIGNQYFTFAIETGESAGNVASAFADAVNNQVVLPVSAAVLSSIKVVVTAKCPGAAGNELTWEIATGDEITASAGAFASGSGGLDTASVLPSLISPALGFQPSHIVFSDAAETTLDDLRDHCDDLADPTVMAFCFGFGAFTGSLSEATALAATQDDWWMNLAAVKTPSLSYELAAAYAVAIASEEDPARPRQGLVVKGVGAPLLDSDVWIHSELQTLIENGVAPLIPNNRGELVIVREVSTLVTESGGAETDVVWDHPIPDTAAYLITQWVAELKRLFPRQKKYQGIHEDLRSATLAFFRKMADPAVALVWDPDGWADSVVFQDHPNNPQRIDGQADPQIVVGLRILALRLRIVF